MHRDFKWRRFRGEIILWAVRWYCRYGISYRDPEEMQEAIRSLKRYIAREVFGIIMRRQKQINQSQIAA